MKKQLMTFLLCGSLFATAQQPVDYVNPFIGTSNYGTTNPGAVCPQGMMSVVPFNVMGSEKNRFDKDSQWWSTPYSADNKFFTGFAHGSLSGVGCPELGGLLLMPTTGELNVDYKAYGSEYKDEVAHPGYYSNTLTKYNIKAEATASMRTGLSRCTFPKGESHILLNLGEGLTNETGATVRIVNDTEIEGSKLLGTFCYNPQAVFPVYFVMKVNKAPKKMGYWKKQREMKGVEAEWDIYSGKYKLYTSYTREMSGDDVGVWFDYDTDEGEAIEVKMGISYVSIENARLNMNTEQPGFDFDKVRTAASTMWNKDLSKVQVEGGTKDEKTIFYTGMYHLLIHPNILQDVNGEYPMMESLKVGHTTGNRYTVFSLWDTYRNVSTLMTLLYPERQLDIIRTMLDMYRENGWLPKWELYGRETFTMEGDPSIPYIVDAWMRGLRDFDEQTAYEAMRKGATTPGEFNLLRPDANDYFSKGYVPLREQYDNSVSHALEYYIADWNLANFAQALGKKEDAKLFRDRSLGYKHYYSKEFGTLRPILPDVKSAEGWAQTLRNETFPELRVGLVHGRMKSAEKDAALSAFRAGDYDILVTTTVVEVGVDVPNATLMVIENAERFGLSQLHQLRGRVGRGSAQSYCVLVSGTKNEETKKRLQALCKTTDGFKIAEQDLALRGPGDFFGSRQHGLPLLKVASLQMDLETLRDAQQAAAAVIQTADSLNAPELAPLKARVEALFTRQEVSLN